MERTRVEDPGTKQYVRMGSDIGGTFTDFVLIDQRTGEIDVEKCLTTPADPSEAVLTGVRLLAERHPGFPGNAESLLHATTLAINAIIERKGAKTGLLTTRGFRDVLEIRKAMRYDLYDIFIEFPQPIVPRHLRLELAERTYQDGTVGITLDERDLEKAVAELRRHEVESIAVVLLHAYANPAHEKRVKALLAELAPGVAVSISSEVLPQIREYERTTTTVVNAYVKPKISRYVSKLMKDVRGLGFRRQLLLMLSSGGMIPAEAAVEYPVRIVESGPAAGAVAAAYVGKLAGHDQLLAFDMGGTTAKGCVIQHGRIDKTSESEVDRVHRFKKGSGIPLGVPQVDLIEIGAGGGSIAKVDEMGRIQVGPESAGASPGPACYGLGGRNATVSDADLVLGYLDAGYFLGGRMRLDVEAARRAIQDNVSTPLKLSLTEGAWGIHELVTENMAVAIRLHMAEKGVDPSRFTLVAFGGAGPVHSTALARRLGINRVLVPRMAGIASAFGLLVSPVSFEMVKTYREAHELDLQRIEMAFAEMESEARSLINRTEDVQQVVFDRSFDVSYVGQDYAVNVPLGRGGLPARSEVRAAFEEAYRRLYGRVYPDIEIQLMNLRVIGSSAKPVVELKKLPRAESPEVGPKSRRQAYSASRGGYVEFLVYDRYGMAAGAKVAGPAIIEERESTTIVDAGSSVEVDDYGTLVVTLSEQK